MKSDNLFQIGSPFSIRVERPRGIQISGECIHRLRLNDLGLFRVHCHGQRGVIQAKIFSTSNNFFDFSSNHCFFSRSFCR